MMNEYFYSFAITFGLIILIIIMLTSIFFIVIELYMTETQSEKYTKEKNIDNMIDKFYNNYDKVKHQTTKEILECLIEMEKLDSIYEEIKEIKIDFMNENEYLKIKEATLNHIIKEKIKDIELSKRKTEKFKSLLDEIEVCRKRFPEYNEIYINNSKKINNRIEQLRN